MRIEELTADDIRQLGAFCDTALITFGGASWRPPHLPIGTSWFILRRLRDILESSLGGRMITLPVHGINIEGEVDTLFQIPKSSAISMISHQLQDLVERMSIRYLVFLTDSLEAEDAFKIAFEQIPAKVQLNSLSFIWWRDGIETIQKHTFSKSGELETSLVLAIAKRLVDLEQKSATRHAAIQATEQAGQQHWTYMEGVLLESVQSMWIKGGNSQTVV